MHSSPLFTPARYKCLRCRGPQPIPGGQVGGVPGNWRRRDDRGKATARVDWWSTVNGEEFCRRLVSFSLRWTQLPKQKWLAFGCLVTSRECLSRKQVRDVTQDECLKIAGLREWLCARGTEFPIKYGVWCAITGVLYNNYRYCIDVNELPY